MDVNRILLDILIVLLAAKVAAELADRVDVPAVVGEIVAGVIIGPSVLGCGHSNEALQTLASSASSCCCSRSGSRWTSRELGEVGRAALAGRGRRRRRPDGRRDRRGLALGMSGKEALFVGAALTATSVGITARVFGDLRALATVEARTVLGAAVADDILGLVILTVVTRIVTEGSVSVLGRRCGSSCVAVGFVVLATLIGVRVVPPLFAFVRRYSRSPGTLVAIALAFTLGVRRARRRRPSSRRSSAPSSPASPSAAAAPAEPRPPELAPVTHLLVPVFFLQIGIDADVGQFAQPAVFGMAAVLLVDRGPRQARLGRSAWSARRATGCSSGSA